jgi:hypothetical protein
LQEAINGACNLVREAHKEFEAAEKRLPVTGNSNLDKQVKLYIQACKDLVTGELNWWYVLRLAHLGAIDFDVFFPFR